MDFIYFILIIFSYCFIGGLTASYYYIMSNDKEFDAGGYMTIAVLWPLMLPTAAALTMVDAVKEKIEKDEKLKNDRKARRIRSAKSKRNSERIVETNSNSQDSSTGQ